MLLFPSLVASGHIETPWNHICEGLEKSNHHANKDFQTRTMRGGGCMYHQDPMFLECFFSYCKFLKLASTRNLDGLQEAACQLANGVALKDAPSPSYLEICQKPIIVPSIDVDGRSRLPLSGLRFLIVGEFSTTKADTEAQRLAEAQAAIEAAAIEAGDSRVPKVKTPTAQEIVANWIKDLGGKVYDKSKCVTLAHSYSTTPHCFILLRDCRELDNGTCSEQELTTRRLVSVLPYAYLHTYKHTYMHM